MVRPSLRLSLAGLALSLAAAPVAAQAYTGPFSGTTTGCFHLDAVACASGTATANAAGLRFDGVTNALFGNATNGSADLVLGSFSLAPSGMNSASYFDARSFTLFASFAQPGGSDTFVAALDGIFFTPVFFGGQLGALQVNYLNDGPRVVSYATANGYGSFLIDIDDEENLTVNLDNSATIRATIKNATFTSNVTATPEPATVALLATGLAAVGGVGMVRRRQARG